jgi:hypothetical protein
MSNVSYEVFVAAISNAALSRRAALQIELAVGLIHFTQENGGTDTAGKANLKAVYHAAGYDCMAKADRDYKTVNRRLNMTAKLFDKFGSSLVNGWVEKCAGDTEALIAYVVTELQSYAFHTLDDVADYIGVESNRTRAASTKNKSGPVNETKGETENGDTSGDDEVIEVELNLDQLQKQLLEKFGNEMLREFAASLIVAVADREAAQEKKAA